MTADDLLPGGKKRGFVPKPSLDSLPNIIGLSWGRQYVDKFLSFIAKPHSSGTENQTNKQIEQPAI